MLPLVRSELYGKIDLLANFGGILGLFLGASALSIFEIVFYLIFYPLIKYYLRRLILTNKKLIAVLDIKEPFYIEKGEIIHIKNKLYE